MQLLGSLRGEEALTMTLLTLIGDGTRVEPLTQYTPILQKDVVYQTSPVTSESYSHDKKYSFNTAFISVRLKDYPSLYKDTSK